VWLDLRSGREGKVLAASEQLFLSVDKNAAAKSAPWRAETLAALDALAKAQRGMSTSPLAGRGIALKRG